MSFSETLRLLREEKNVTQKEVAEQCGLTATCICQLESGARNPTGSTIKSLASYFNVTADFLLGIDNFTEIQTVKNRISKYTKDEKKLISYYRDMKLTDKRKIKKIAQLFATNKGD